MNAVESFLSTSTHRLWRFVSIAFFKMLRRTNIFSALSISSRPISWLYYTRSLFSTAGPFDNFWSAYFMVLPVVLYIASCLHCKVSFLIQVYDKYFIPMLWGFTSVPDLLWITYLVPLSCLLLDFDHLQTIKRRAFSFDCKSSFIERLIFLLIPR